MKLTFPDTNPYDQSIGYFGNKPRYSTMTGVRLVAPHRLVCTNFIQRTMYLVTFDLEAEKFEISDMCDTKAPPRALPRLRPKKASPSELLDYDASRGLFAASHFSQSGVSFYSVGDKKLRYRRWLDLRQFGPMHGVKFWPSGTPPVNGSPDMVSLGGNEYRREDLLLIANTHPSNQNAGAYVVDVASGQALVAIREPGWYSKDVTLVPNSRMKNASGQDLLLLVAIYIDGTVSSEPSEPYNSKFCLYGLDPTDCVVERLAEIVVPNGHCDACRYHDGRLYATIELFSEGGKVLVFDLDDANGTLEYHGGAVGYGFPHGIDIHHGLVAVTEYEGCAVTVESLDTFNERISS